MGEKRKPLGIKLKGCVQVVRSPYQTSGMDRIVINIYFRGIFSFTFKCSQAFYLNLRFVVGLLIEKGLWIFFFSVSWFLGPRSVCTSYLL